MSVIRIDLDKPVQEFEIGGKVYEVSYDDDSLKKYEKQAVIFYKKTREKIDLDKASKREMEEYTKEMHLLLEETMDVFFGEGSFKEIYETAGKSLINITKVISILIDWLNSKMSLKHEEIQNYYTK